MGVDEWLDHGEGGGGAFLTLDWDENDEYRFWLHPKAPIKALWRHPWKTIGRDGKSVRMMRYTSMEKPFVLDGMKRNFRDDSGALERPIQMDPFAFLLEWVHEQIESGGIDWCDEIFKFEPPEGESEVIHAGGFVGKFQSRKLSDEEKKEMRKNAGVRQDEAFKQNGKAGESVVFIVVDNEDPGKGPLICPVPGSLSKSFQEEVKRRKKTFCKDPVKADPLKTPTCFSVEKDTSGDFPKYVVAATDDEFTDDIKAAFEEPLPDTRQIFAPSNVAVLRQSFEEHWVHDVVPDWDSIFEKAMEALKDHPASKLPESFDHGANKKKDDDEEDEDEPKSERKPATKPAKDKKAEEKPAKPAKKEEPPPKEEEKDEEEAGDEEPEAPPDPASCDKCNGEIPDKLFPKEPKTGDEVACPHCPAIYVYDEKTENYDLKPEAPKTGGIRASRRTRS